MASSRLKIIGRLTLLVGLPLSIIGSLFACGLYVGATHQHGVLSFEKNWLRLDVEVPPEAAPQPPETKPAEASAADPAAEPPAADPPATPPVQPATPVAVSPPVTGPPAQVPPATDAPPAADPVPVQPKVNPVEGDLAARLALPVTVGVKVIVDQETIDARKDWIDYVQRTVSEASLVYEKQFGIELELAGVGRWPIAVAGMDAEGLVADLKTRPREGADVLIGITNRPLDGRVSGRSETPAADSPFNAVHAVVYATPGRQQKPHLRTLLHEIGHLFGALDITDPNHPDYQARSWMSYAPAPDGIAPWIDAQNRTRILSRKDKPFAAETGGSL